MTTSDDRDPMAETTRAALADLAGRLGIEAAAVSVVSAEAVTWRDGSLGCPEPGMMYPQVLTDGTRIVLEHAGTHFEYHSGRGRPPFLCQDPQPPLHTG